MSITYRTRDNIYENITNVPFSLSLKEFLGDDDFMYINIEINSQIFSKSLCDILPYNVTFDTDVRFARFYKTCNISFKDGRSFTEYEISTIHEIIKLLVEEKILIYI